MGELLSRRSVRVGCSLASGLLWGLAGNLHPHWWAAWLAPIPVLLAAFHARGRESFLLGALAGAVGTLGTARYLLALAPPAVFGLVVVLSALGAGLTVLLAAAATRRWPAAAAVLAYPTADATWDFVQSLTSPHGTFGSLAYSQVSFLPALQVAALGGAPAVVFLVDLFGSAVAVAWHHRLRPWWVPAASLAAIAAALGLGAARSAATESPLAVPVALLSSDRFAGVPHAWNEVWSLYRPAVEAAAAQGAQLVVLPEKIAALSPAEAVTATEDLVGAARSLHIDLVAGVLVVDGKTGLNRALLVRSSGDVLRYDKQHPVPGLESGIVPGSSALLFEMEQGRGGVAICKDMDFAALGQDYGRHGASLMLVPAWDFRGRWGEDGWLHSRMAVLRAVEGGFTLARSARIGRLTVSDRYGRVLAEAESSPGMATVLFQAPLAAGPTPYAMRGDLFGWGCVGLLLLGIAALVLDRRESRAGGAG